MKLTDFDYTLPQNLIAQYPTEKRDTSRMLILNKRTGAIKHKLFYNLPDYLNKNDMVVLNDTKVFKARLLGKRKAYIGKIDLLVLREHQPYIFECLVKPAKKLQIGTELEFENNKLKAQVVDIKGGMRFIRFSNRDLLYFNKIGLMPLPPYIKRNPNPEDDKRYQTIYAKKLGAVAAPTAGLHFTDSVIETIRGKKANITYITLHVGYGTFRPVKCDNILEHKMHSERFEISKKSADLINKTKRDKGKILAVGTTTCRTLEFATSKNNNNGQWTINDEGNGETDLFIYPGYKFKMTDMLLTNFHLPKTTLLMLVCAFAGYGNTMKAYREAVEKKYRFYSYGDCMLII